MARRKIGKLRREALRDVQRGSGKARWLRWLNNKRKGNRDKNRWPEGLSGTHVRSSVYTVSEHEFSTIGGA